MFENEPDLLTRSDAQRLLKVGKNTILFYIREGYLPAYMLGNSYRIDKKDLEIFVKNSTFNAPNLL